MIWTTTRWSKQCAGFHAVCATRWKRMGPRDGQGLGTLSNSRAICFTNIGCLCAACVWKEGRWSLYVCGSFHTLLFLLSLSLSFCLKFCPNCYIWKYYSCKFRALPFFPGKFGSEFATSNLHEKNIILHCFSTHVSFCLIHAPNGPSLLHMFWYMHIWRPRINFHSINLK